jgi:predicted  nucleic acid-binding Zn-ribbon protein
MYTYIYIYIYRLEEEAQQQEFAANTIEKLTEVNTALKQSFDTLQDDHKNLKYNFQKYKDDADKRFQAIEKSLHK